VRLVDLDPGQTVAEKVLTLAAMHRLRHDLQRRDLNAFAIARHRRQTEHMARMRHRRRVAA
jgi:hypothetical protein